MQGEIWVIDDETGIRELISEILEDEGYLVKTAANAAEGRALFKSGDIPSLVLLDIWMPDTDGVTLLKEWKSAGNLQFPVVMLSGHATIDTAVEATKVGAFDFLEKPIGLQKLLASVDRAIRHRPVPRGPNVDLTGVGYGSAIDVVKSKIDNLLKNNNPIMLTGETGVGFAEIARAIHHPDTPYVILEGGQRLVVSPLEIMESARGGTLFCEDLTVLSRTEQRSFLFILQRARQYQIGVICACNDTLANLITQGGFDQNLFTILSQCEVNVPPLRARKSDVPLLALSIAEQLLPGSKDRFTPAALAMLEGANWPGNLIQLSNVLSTLLFDANIGKIEAQHINSILGGSELLKVEVETAPEVANLYYTMTLRDAREAFERSYFEHLLQKEEFNMSRVADKSGLERTHLYRKLKQLNIKFTRRQGGGDLTRLAEEEGFNEPGELNNVPQ